MTWKISVRFFCSAIASRTFIFGYIFLTIFLSFILRAIVDFLCITGEAVGVKGNTAQSVFYLPKDAGCLETSKMMIESALCLAKQEDELPASGGGFMSTAYGLGDVLIHRLGKVGVHFECTGVSKKTTNQSKL